MLLKDKIALVTGSTHHIGLAIARAFAREGLLRRDIADSEQIAAVFEHIKKQHGRLNSMNSGSAT